MNCPNCNKKIEKEYMHCPECGININAYKERKKLFSEIKSSIFLAVLSTLLILGYPSMQYVNTNVSDISLKEFLSSNSKEVVNCSKISDDKEISISLTFKEDQLEQYEVVYNYKDNKNIEEDKDNLSKYSNETGYIALQEENKLSYIVETRSIINEQIYDMDGVKLNYQDNLISLKELGYTCK